MEDLNYINKQNIQASPLVAGCCMSHTLKLFPFLVETIWSSNPITVAVIEYIPSKYHSIIILRHVLNNIFLKATFQYNDVFEYISSCCFC